MWFERLFAQLINEAVDQFPAIYLSGARQVGKTSLIRKLYPDFDYISMDVPSIAESAETNPQNFFSNYSDHLIIDEIQYAPSLFRFLKGLIDENRDGVKFILTGSQNFLLLKGIKESLAGRCAILDLNPLVFQEICDFIPSSINSLDLIIKGGYPEIWKTNINYHLWFQSYLVTYLERDVRNSLNIQSLRDFERFLRAVAFRSGRILSFSDISKDVGIAVSTCKEWISVLQASHQITLVEPYFRNLGKRLVKSPKVYFNDSGLACYLNGLLDSTFLVNSNLLGCLWETYVFNQILGLSRANNAQQKIWFWRTSTGEEVDFVFDYGGKYKLIEVKFSEKISKKDLRGIIAFKKYYGEDSVISSTIVSNTQHIYKIESTEVVNIRHLVF